MIIETTENNIVYRVHVEAGEIRAAISKCGTDLLRFATELTDADKREIRLINLDRREWLDDNYLTKSY